MKNPLQDSHRKITDALVDYTKRLLAARIKEGVNAQTLAKKAKLDPGTVSRWGNNEVVPSLANCLRAIDAWEGNLVEVLRDAAPTLAELVILSEAHPERTEKLVRILSDPKESARFESMLDLMFPD